MKHNRHTAIRKDTILLVGYFFGLILAGTLILSLPFVMQEGSIRVIDALFTATSAVCVTGLTTIDTTTFSRAGQAVIMILIQLGGLGIISFSTIYLFMPRLRISIFTRGFAGDYTVPTVEYHTRTVISRIVAWTLIFEIAGMLSVLPALRHAGYSLFDALFHAVSAFCNAGFSTIHGGMEAFRDNLSMNLATMLLIVAGGLGFIVLQDISRVMRGKKRHLSYHSSVVVRTSLWLILGGAILYFIFESSNAFRGMSLPSRIMASFFQSVTTRTAGFDTVPQADMSGASHVLSMMLMFIGASPASTGGGIKTTTFYLLVLVALRFREGQNTLIDGNRSVSPYSIYKAAAIVFRAVLIIIVVTAVVLLSERGRGAILSAEQALFESISAFGTVGLSMGITPHLGSVSKLALIVGMFMGRVGLFAMALPSAANGVERFAAFPKADILI